MSEMVERVAKAQYEHAYGPRGLFAPEQWDNLPDHAKEPWHEAAVVAIQAMGDGLTDAMAEVIAKHGRCCGGIAHTLWVETIEESLK